MRGALSFLYLTPFLFDMDLPPNLGETPGTSVWLLSINTHSEA